MACIVDQQATSREEKHAVLEKLHFALAARCCADLQVLKDLETRAWCDLMSDAEVRSALGQMSGLEENLRGLPSSVEHLKFRQVKHTMLAKIHQFLAERQRLRFPHLMPGQEYEARRRRGDRSSEELKRGFEEASDTLRSDQEIVMAIVAVDGLWFEHAANEVRADRDVVLQVVAVDGFALEHASPDLKNDRDVVMAAIKSQPLALESASDELKRDRELVLAALKRQTVENVRINDDENVMHHADSSLGADEQLVLEAVRVQGAAVAYATSDLRKCKDFLLKAARVAPPDQLDMCYAEADSSIHQVINTEHFRGAVRSALALKGDCAPVLTVAPGTASCYTVTMFSGTSFSCDAQATPATEHNDRKEAESVPDAAKDLVVGCLVQIVLADLAKRIQVEPTPERVFIVFRKDGCSDSTAATPWDWNRPVSDFL